MCANETSVDLKIEHHFDVSFEVSSKELTLSVDDFNGRLLQPAMSALAQKIDNEGLFPQESINKIESLNAV